MQPNEQESTQPQDTPPAQSGAYPPTTPSTHPAPTPTESPQTPPGTIAPIFATPDFFKLDPIADPSIAIAKKHKQRRNLVIAVVLGFVVIVAGFGMYMYSQFNLPQNQFERILQAQLPTERFFRTTTLTPVSKNDPTMVNISVKSDFSNPTKPKSEISYETSIAGKKVISGKSVYVDNVRYGLLDTTTDLFNEAKLTSDIWYKAPEKPKQFNKIFDNRYYGEQSNNVLSILPMGNFSQDKYLDIMNNLLSRDIFNIKSVSDDGDDKAFSVVINSTKMHKYYADLSKQLNIVQVDKSRLMSVANITGESKMWFNKNSKKLMQTEIIYRIGQSGSKVKVVTKYDYDARVNITKPEKALDFILPSTGVES